MAALTGKVAVVTGASKGNLKARIEERFLREELGQNAYGNYAARVPMLLPFAPL
jgi:protein-S-isoprenylcysteine O-methyltransferase Ste14